MAFCCQMHHNVGREFGKDAMHGVRVDDVSADKAIIRVRYNGRERIEISGIGQFVQNEHSVRSAADKMTNDRRSNESCAARNQKATFHSEFEPPRLNLHWPLNSKSQLDQ